MVVTPDDLVIAITTNRLQKKRREANIVNTHIKYLPLLLGNKSVRCQTDESLNQKQTNKR